MSAPVHFTAQSLAEVFRDVYLGERTGTLVLGRESVKKRISFARGLIESATGEGASEQFGPRLVDERKVSAGALEEAEKETEGPTQLALRLHGRDLVSRQVLLETMDEIVRSVLHSVFAWDGGEAQFEEEPPSEDEFFECDVLDTFLRILDGIVRMGEFAPMHDALQALDNSLRLRTPAPVPIERLTLSRSQGFILSRIDGGTTYKDVISTLPTGDDEEAARFLFGLMIMGVVDFEPPLCEGPFRAATVMRDHADRRALEAVQEKTIRQAYQRIRKQNPHEVLGVTPNASRRAIERAYEEAKALFSRERLLPRIRDGFRTELGVIESRLVEAYLQLTQPETRGRTEEEVTRGARDVSVQDLLVRPELDKTRSRTEKDEASRVAEVYYSKARQSMRSGDYHNAIQYGKLAISYNAEDARFYFMLADCQVRNPEARWQRLAEQNYTKATELDPWNADYWISLGRFYKKRGLALRARRQFEEALKLVPAHEEATRELETLGS